MRLHVVAIFIGCIIPSLLNAQTPKEAKLAKRIELIKQFDSQLIYPLLKGSNMTGVLPVPGVANKPASNQVIKIIFDFTEGTANNALGTNVNEGLEEVARIINLHIAAGIKKQNLHTVIIFHGPGIKIPLNDAWYQQKFNNSSPNTAMLQQLQASGVTMVACGQSLLFNGHNKSQLSTGMQLAFSAMTTLTKYQSLGYVVLDIGE